MFRFAVIVLAFLAVAYSNVVSAQGALNDKAYRLFLARVTTFSNGMMSFSTTGVPLATSAPIVFSAPTFTAGGAAVTTASRVAVGSATAAVSVVGSASGASVFAAFRALTGGPIGLALLASPIIISWLSDSGARINSETGAVERSDPAACTVGPCYEYRAASNFHPVYRGPYLRTPDAAAKDGCANAAANDSSIQCGSAYANSTTSWVAPGNARYTSGNLERKAVPPVSSTWMPSSMDDIADYMDKPTPPEVMQELLKAGAKIEVIPRFINGPEYVPLPKEVTVTETPEKITTTEKTKGIQLEYKVGTDPVTGQPTPYVQAIPKETTVVKEKDKATGVEKIISTTETEGGEKPKTENPEIETCGLPGKPKCLIDETGTPDPVTDDKYKPRLDDYQTKQKDLKDVASGVADKSFFTGWGAVFVTPPLAACVPYTLPRDMGVIDPCPVVDGMRSIMAYIWAIGGLWLSMRLIRQVM